MAEISRKSNGKIITIKGLDSTQLKGLTELFGNPIDIGTLKNPSNQQYQEKGLTIKGTNYSYSVYDTPNYGLDLYSIEFQKES